MFLSPKCCAETPTAARLAAGVAVLAAALACSPPPRRLVLHAGRLLDGTGSGARHDVTIVAVDGIITAMEPGAPSSAATSADTAYVDASELTVLPGLVNAHVQLFDGPGQSGAANNPGLGRVVAILHDYLRAGVTTLVDIGSPTARAVALRQYVGTARQRGPRLVVSGAAVIGGDRETDVEPDSAIRPAAVLIATSAVRARALCRGLVDRGVDFVAVAFSGPRALADLPGNPTAAPPDRGRQALCAAVEEAHRQERRAVAVVGSSEGLPVALRCRPDALLLAGRVSLQAGVSGLAEAAGLPVAVGGQPAQASALRRAGAALALGTGPADSTPAEALVAALRALVSAGLRPEQAIAAASAGAARVVGLDQAIGRIEVGYRADLVAVAGRPDERVEDIRRVRHVLIDGVMQRRDGPCWYDRPLALAYRFLAALTD